MVTFSFSINGKMISGIKARHENLGRASDPAREDKGRDRMVNRLQAQEDVIFVQIG